MKQIETKIATVKVLLLMLVNHASYWFFLEKVCPCIVFPGVKLEPLNDVKILYDCDLERIKLILF